MKTKIVKVLILLAIILGTICIGLNAIFMVAQNFWNKNLISGEKITKNNIYNGETGALNNLSGNENSKDLNILIVGTNEGMTDTILLTKYELKTNSLKMLSIPRDTKINGSSDGKINSLYAEYGINSLIHKVEDITNVKIDYYALINSKGLEKIVDTIGGVTVDVPMNMNYDDPMQNLHIHLKKGLQKLNGSQSVGVVRFRKGENNTGYAEGDIGRIKTQHIFLEAFIQQLIKPQNLLKINKISQIAFENIKTNATFANILPYMGQISNIKNVSIKSETLPGEGKYIGKLSYFVYNADESKKLINEMFFNIKPDNVVKPNLQNQSQVIE